MILYFLLVILALGIITSYDDITKGKIKNKYIVSALGLGILIHIILFSIGISDLSEIIIAGIYLFAALALGVVLWLLGYWSAGDAKLYTAFAMLIPPETYHLVTTPLPVIDLVINTILPIFIYLVAVVLIRSSFKEKTAVVKQALKPSKILNILLVIFSISWLSGYLFSYMSMPPNYLLTLLFIMVAYRIISAIIKEYTTHFLVVTGIIRVFLNKDYIISIPFIKSFLLITAGFIIVMVFISGMGKLYYDSVNIYRLRPGMQLLQAVLKNGISLDIDEAEPRRMLFKQGLRGLTEYDVNMIKNAHRKGKLHFNELKVQQTIPFAPFMFLGTMMTIICQGNVILFVKALI